MKQIVKRRIKRVGRTDDDGRFEFKPADPSLLHSIDALLTSIDRVINDANGC
jgi:hypothetical protein